MPKMKLMMRRLKRQILVAQMQKIKLMMQKIIFMKQKEKYPLQ
jgi:hypothetical protein